MTPEPTRTAELQPVARPQREIRAELASLFERHLLGPLGGPDEEVDENRVRDRYLVGVLAPAELLIDPASQDPAAQDGAAGEEDGDPDLQTPASTTLFPSSMGLSFSVAGDAGGFTIEALWGQYKRETSAYLTRESGDPKLVWRRYARGGTSPVIALKSGAIEPWYPEPDEQPSLYVRGRMRRQGEVWIVSLYLVNNQREPRVYADEAWLFQPELIVSGAEGDAVFVKRPTLDRAQELEAQHLEMTYRRRQEFACGHSVSVSVDLSDDSQRVSRIRTSFMPRSEVPRMRPPVIDPGGPMSGLELRMKELAKMDAANVATALGPLAEGYAAWIQERQASIESRSAGLDGFEAAAGEAVSGFNEARDRIQAGIDLLAEDAVALKAFRFANQVMYDQRIHTAWSLARRRAEKTLPDLAVFDRPEDHRWFPFQLGFILMNLSSLVKLDHPDRKKDPQARADLLWFPTGGGKTEAYLGLAAFTLAIRRLQGTVAGHRGDLGVAVLLRFTLRVLTLQQFQRASALLCACEVVRRSDSLIWGETPFRIGLWVGQRTTPNQTADAEEFLRSVKGNAYGGGAGSPQQLTNCPWCGESIDPGRNLEVEAAGKGRGRTLIYCGDRKGLCPFTKRASPGEGLPVMVVDEEIYRNLPSVLVSTADKFAQLPWRSQLRLLFGRVDQSCSRHGFLTSDEDHRSFHTANKSTGLPAARTEEHLPLRPPDLIIQDELHLISGPLGTLSGLYETAIDQLCEWDPGSGPIRPKIVASTATIRKAGDQIRALFNRDVRVFPPPGIDAEDNFFAREVPLTDEEPGRLYLGVCSPGRRMKSALVQTYVTLLRAAQTMFEDHGEQADPWMTLVGYFNSIRELGGMRRLVEDPIRSLVYKSSVTGLSRRSVSPYPSELTSRITSTDIPQILDRLEVQYRPDPKSKDGKPNAPLKSLEHGVDVLLATNMISVGVDISRLGMMVVSGQPKTVAEYIQATSRVGRSSPGLVVTVYNWSRPRDLSHYESFEHFHSTFYKHVEALSVTPFSHRALDRGLSALLVSLVRHLDHPLSGNEDASRIQEFEDLLPRVIDAIIERAREVTGTDELEPLIRGELERRIQEWRRSAGNSAGGRQLVYRLLGRKGTHVPLLERAGGSDWSLFTCLNSLRNVEPSVDLVFLDRPLQWETD